MRRGVIFQVISALARSREDSRRTRLTEIENKNSTKTATATVVMAVFAGVSLLTAGATVWILSNQLSEMRAEQRAWIHTTPTLDGPVTIDKDSMRFTIDGIFANTGHLPGLNVFVDIQAASMVGNPNFLTLQKQECETVKKVVGSPLSQGYVEFPGQPLPTKSGIDIPMEKLRQGGLPLNKFIPIIYGCVTYQSAGDSTIHQTGLAYQVLATYSDGSFGAFNLPKDAGETITQDAILRQPIIPGSEFAN